MPLVAMTREMGSLGRDVAGRLAERMRRKVVYQEIIDQLANKMRLRKSHVARLLEGRAGLWETLTADKTSLTIFTAEETFRFLLDGETGVIRGWGAVHLLRPVPHVVRVRVCAPLDLRIGRMMERLGTLDRDAVAREIELNEEAHSAITRRHFGINWRDPEHYDIVLSTERMSVDECVEELESVMHLRRFQETAESVQLAEDLALEWAVRGALRRDPRTLGLRLGFECRRGRVRLSGALEYPAQAREIQEIAGAVRAVRSVELVSRVAVASRLRAEA